ELPLDRPRPDRRSLAAEAVPFEVATGTATALRALGDSCGVGLPTVLFALYGVLLHRYSGQTDTVVATPIPGRPTGTPAPGPAEATAAVRYEITGEQSFRELLGTVRRALDGVAQTGPPVSATALLGRPGFSFRDVPRLGELAGSTPEFVTVHQGAAYGDLSLRFTQDDDRLTGQLVFATDVFDTATAHRALDHYRTLADSVINAPGLPVGELPILTAAEERTVAELNSAVADVPALTFHQLFEAQAERTPDAIAVRSQRTSLTYSELNGLANQLADLLRGLGAGPGTSTGICLDRGVRMVVAVLGILKAGGAYVPVDPRDPAERRTGILEDARVLAVVTSDPAAVAGHRTVELDTDCTALRGRPTHNVAAPDSGPSDAAYLLYTSGSTSRPKGVVVENRQLVSYTYAVLKRLGIEGPLHYAMVQPLTVDSSVTALMPPLCTGGEVHLISRDCALDAGKLADWVQTHGVDLLKIAPSHLRALQASPRFTELLPRQYLVVGGEASDWRWLCGLQQLVPHCRVFNHYGPTETTVGVLTLRVADHPDAAWDIAPIGIPLPHTQAHVVDGAGRPVPVGVPGELLIGGDNLARGYHRRDELTASAFVPDHLGGRPGARLYRTGDIVRRLADGSIAFLGRRDDQIKIRGFRVALGEIEAALTGHDGVRSAVVVVREDTPGDRRVVAYVAPHTPGTFRTEDLDRHLRERLSPHMVPQAVVVLDALPLSPHGKVDRSALPAPAAGRAAHTPALPLRNELERLVADVWKELLPEVPSVGVEENFFDIGGHSLLLVALQHKLQSVAGRDIELLDLFRHTSVRDQAAFLAGLGEPDAPTDPKTRGVQQNALMKRRQQQLRAKRGRPAT
ncbi:MAG TPA: non-ribosomal peptide synthetase, partial [Streptomyces sp.]|nr:non-ribosomal peptide synthetase [Streptomyces sp.]